MRLGVRTGPGVFLGVLAAVAASLIAAAPAAAANLVSFTDNDPNRGIYSNISTTRLWAEGWTQTVSSSDVEVSVLFSPASLGGGQWWITTALGSGATLADVVASGDFTAPNTTALPFDFNSLPLTVLATGLNFAPGTYYLVLNGPDINRRPRANWGGDETANVTANLAPGFTAMSAFHSEYLMFPDPFGPASTFVADEDAAYTLNFKLLGEVSAGGGGGGGGGGPIPEPATWTVMITGFALVGAAMRRRVRGVPPPQVVKTSAR